VYFVDMLKMVKILMIYLVMTSKLTPLYIAVSLADLNKLAEVKFDNKSNAAL
jgi:hypothetical protein